YLLIKRNTALSIIRRRRREAHSVFTSEYCLSIQYTLKMLEVCNSAMLCARLVARYFLAISSF
ncbi:hypothetical protein OFN46_34905, partial [Escherichia coli]|nr:hypothetical protein [Escherichia coli]